MNYKKKRRFKAPKPAIEPIVPLSIGERVADVVAEFGGSWTFIFCFFGFMMVWMVLNSIQFAFQPFDPFPYILLNLILSCLAAMQAPIIMMSQNRQEQKDRQRAEQDLFINQKAEAEILSLHRKLDSLSAEHKKLFQLLYPRTQP